MSEPTWRIAIPATCPSAAARSTTELSKSIAPPKRLPLHVTFNVRSDVPDLALRPHASVTVSSHLPPACVVGDSYADALEVGACWVLDLPDLGFRLPNEMARRLIQAQRGFQGGHRDLLDCLVWLVNLVEAQAGGARWASVSHPMPRCLFLPSLFMPRQDDTKVAWQDVHDAAQAAFSASAQAARSLVEGGTLLDEIERSVDGATFRSSATWQLAMGMRLTAAEVLQHGLDVLGEPIEVVSPAVFPPCLTVPAGAVEWPQAWVRHRAEQWVRQRSERIARLRLFRADPSRLGAW